MATRIGAIEGVLRLRNEFSSELTKAAGDLSKFGDRLKVSGRTISDAGSALTRNLSLPILALGGYAVKAAIDFESSFAGVRKTVNATEAEFAELESRLRDLAAGDNAIPIDVNELNAVAEAAGQLGIAKGDIVAFTRTMADLGQTTNLSAQEAAIATAQFQNIFGAAGKEVDRFGSTLVALGNAGASTERQIIEMGLRIAGAGTQIGLTQGEVLAFASALSSVGIDAEAGGSALSKVMINIALAVSKGGRELHNFAAVAGQTSQQFSASFKKDAAGAVTEFIQGLGRLKSSGGDALKTLDTMGITEVRMRDALLRAAGAGDLLTDSLKLQQKAWKDNNALSEEARKRYQTFASQLKITWNQIKDTAITLGQSLLPVLRDVLELMKPWVERLAGVAEWFSKLPQPVRTTALVFAGLAASIGPVLIVTGQLITAWGTVITLAPRFAAAIRLAAGPWGLLAGAITLAVVALDQWIAKQSQVMQADIEGLVSDTNRVGEAWQKVRKSQALTAGEIQNLSNDLARTSNEIAKLVLHAKNLEQVGKTSGVPVDTSPIRRRITLLEQEKKNIISVLRSVKNVVADVQKPTQDLAADIGNLGGSLNLLSGEGEELTKELSRLRQELSLNIQQNQKLISAYSRGNLVDRKETEARIAAIRRSHDLHLAYLEDVAQFGPAAAIALRPLRQADYDAARGAEEAEKTYNELAVAIDEVSKSAGKFIRSGLDDELEANKKAANETARAWLDFKKTLDSLQLDTEIALHLSGLDETSETLLAAEEAYLSMLRSTGGKTIAEAEAILSSFAALWGKTIDDIRAALLTIEETRKLESVRGESQSSLARFRKMTDEWKDLAEKWPADAADIQARINSITQDFWNEQLGHWSSALDFLAQEFGGFFNYLSRLAQAIQSAQGFGSSVSGIASGFGASASTASMIGGAASNVALVYAFYNLAKEIQADRKSRRFQGMNALVFDAGQVDMRGLDAAGKDLARHFQGIVDQVEAALGISIDDLDTIGIKIRNDGKRIRAYVMGQFIGVFGDAQEAIEAAFLQVFRAGSAEIRGMSELMAQGFRELPQSEDLEEILSFLSELREIGDLGLTSGAIQIRETIRHLDDLWQSLARLRNLTPAVVQGFNDIVATEIRSWQSWRDAITQRERTPEEELEYRKQEAAMFNAQRALRLAELNLRKIEIQAEIQYLMARGNIVNAGIDIMRTDIEARGAFTKAMVEITAAGISYYNEAIALLLAQLAAIDQIIATMPTEIDIPSITLPKPARGGRGDDLASVRDFIRDRSFELGLRSLTEYQRRIAEVTREYDTQIAQAGKDISLRAQLIALKEEELRLLAKEQADSTVQRFREFLGLISPFEQVRATAADLIKQIEDSLFGNARKVTMIGRVLADLDRQIETLSRETAAGLFSGMLADLEKFGAQESLLTEVRRNLAIIEHTLKVAQYRTEIALLKTQGRLAPEIMAALERAFDFIAGFDPTEIFGDDPDRVVPGYENYIDQAKREREEATRQLEREQEEAADRIKKAMDLLARYQEDGVDDLTRQLREIDSDFVVIIEALGATAEVVSARSRAIANAMRDAFAGIVDLRDSLVSGPDSFLPLEQQLASTIADYNRIINEVRSGDYSELGDLETRMRQAVDLAGKVWGTSTGGFAELREGMIAQIDDLLRSIGLETSHALGSELGSLLHFPNLMIESQEVMMEESNRRMITSIDGVGSVVDFRGARQEVLLERAIRAIDDFHEYVRTNNASGGSTAGIGYGS